MKKKIVSRSSRILEFRLSRLTFSFNFCPLLLLITNYCDIYKSIRPTACTFVAAIQSIVLYCIVCHDSCIQPGSSFCHFATPLRASTHYVSYMSTGEFRLPYETYHTRSLFFERYTHANVLNFSVYAYPRAMVHRKKISHRQVCCKGGHYLRHRRYTFLPVFVCLSVCLSTRLLKNACMDLDEMLRVDRCRDTDELINF